MKTKQSHCEIVENLLKVALMYKTRGEFQKGSRNVYNSAYKKGLLDEVCSHMILQKGGQGYWVIFENVREEALKYKTRNEFKKRSCGAYKSAIRNGWLDMVCSHMILKKGDPGYWDIFENVQEEALMYKTRNEFKKGSRGAYDSALRKGLLDEVCSHMGKSLNDKPRYIYSFVWEVQNLVYVGLTQDPKERKRMHLNNDSGIVYQTIMEYGEPIFKIITENPVHVNVAGEHEKKWIQTYTELGYTPVNIAKPGALGGYSRMWDFENVREEALMYETRLEFQKGSGGAYESARKNGWLDIVCSHMVLQKGDPGYWDIFENVREEALKHKTRSEFSKGSPGAYHSAYRNGWLDIVCSHMVLEKGDPGYWDVFENTREEALMYETRNEFSKGSSGAYLSARRNGWLDIVCSHMILQKGDRGYWDIFENVQEEALKHKTRLEFSKGSSGAYLSARKKGWLDIVCSHMGK